MTGKYRTQQEGCQGWSHAGNRKDSRKQCQRGTGGQGARSERADGPWKDFVFTNSDVESHCPRKDTELLVEGGISSRKNILEQGFSTTDGFGSKGTFGSIWDRFWLSQLREADRLQGSS